MKAWVETLAAKTWAELRAVGCDEWLWLDTDGDGVHVAAELPEAEPWQVTHVWGWASDRAVRARVDVDLPHPSGDTGVAGAVLRWGEASVGADPEMDVEEGTHRVWHAGGGRADMKPVDGLHEGAAGVRLRSLMVDVVTADASGLTSQAMTFLRR